MSLCSVGFMVSSQRICFPVLPLPQAVCVCVYVCVCLCVSAKERDFDLTAKLTTASEWCQNEANRVSFPVRVCMCVCILLHFSPEVNLN